MIFIVSWCYGGLAMVMFILFWQGSYPPWWHHTGIFRIAYDVHRFPLRSFWKRAVWGNKKDASWCDVWRWYDAIHIRRVFFSKNVFFNGNANKANIFKKWHEFVTGHKHFGWSEHIEKNKEDLHHHMHQPKHSSKQRPLRLKRCFLMVSAPKPLKQQSFNNKSFRNHCKGNVFFPDLKNLDAEKHKHRTVLPPSTGETKLPIVFLGVRFRLSWPGKIGIPQWKRQMAYPGARWE